MLQEMRKYAKSWVASIFLGALALSFGVWGIADIFKGSVDDSVATVGSTKVSSAFFEREYNNATKNQLGPDGKPITTDEARKLGLPEQALQQLVNRTALDNATARYGLTSSATDAATMIKGARAFAGQLGTFDKTVFDRAMQERGYSEQEFINLVRNDISRDQLTTAASAGFALPPTYALALFSFLNEVRAADYVVIPASAVGTIAPPNDAVLQAYIRQNAARFSTPEYREVDYAYVTPDDLMPTLQVTDQQLKDQYQLRLTDPRYTYVVPEKRDVEQITFRDEKSAAAAKAKIDAGGSFADAAKERGGAPDSLGSVSKDDLGPRGAAAFALPVGGVSAPQKNLTGWVLLHVTKITPAIDKTFEDVKDDIRKDVLTQLAQSKMSDISNAYTDANSGGLGLQEAGKKVGMHTGHLAAVDANGLAPDGSKTPLADHAEVLKQVFAADVGDDGDPFGTQSGALYVVKVDGLLPPKLKPLDPVRAQATTDWTAGQRSKLLAAKAEALAAQATKTHSLAAASALAGTPAVSSGPLHRPQDANAENPVLPPRFVGQIFTVPGGTAVAGPSAKGDSYIVALVTGVGHPPMSTASLDFIQGARQLSAQATQDFDPLLAHAARQKQGVTINQANVDRVTGQGS
jgi:peptidyl-prolyl cis-trans isomerase D